MPNFPRPPYPRRAGAAALAVVAAATGAVVAVGVGAAGGSGRSAATTVAAAPTPRASTHAVALDTSPLSAADIYKRDAPGVVDITVSEQSSKQYDPFGGGQQQSGGEGSGFVLDTRGDIVTNEHVIDGATSISVSFADGTKATAKLVARDTSSDLAVIRVSVPASKLHPLTLGSSSGVVPGDRVVAIGSPFGYARSITEGIISAVGRQIQSPNGATIPSALQTDAAINPGNSGGPLIDAAGNVIGIDAQIKSSSQGNEGIGFAIPVDTVKSVTSALIAGHTVQHAYLGVELADNGRIGSVQAGSPAAKAGLKAGDVITRIDDQAVSSADAISADIANHASGDRVTLVVHRDGKDVTVSVTLGSRAA